MAELKQYAVLAVGFLMAGGFAFGGMASYSSMVNTQNPNSNTMNPELPEQNFKMGAYNLSVTERMYLTLQKDVVFVSAIYNTTESQQQLSQLENITGKFNGRVYVSVVEASESPSVNSYQLTQFPAVLVYGYKTSRQQVPAKINGEITEKSVSNLVCSNMNQWKDAASYCAGT